MAEWVVTVEATRTPPSESPSDDEAADSFSDLLAEHHGFAGLSPSGWTATLSVEAGDAGEAHSKAVGLAVELAAKAGIGEHRVVLTEVALAEVHDAALERSNFPAIVGAGEVIDILGVSKQRLHQLRNDGRFPLPMLELKSGPLWMRPAIDRWAEVEWKRTPGRVKSSPVDVANGHIDRIHEIDDEHRTETMTRDRAIDLSRGRKALEEDLGQVFPSRSEPLGS
jgi:hypothetical protein